MGFLNVTLGRTVMGVQPEFGFPPGGGEMFWRRRRRKDFYSGRELG